MNAPGALTILMRAKQTFGAIHCALAHSGAPELHELIKKQPEIWPFISATYERTPKLSLSQNSADPSHAPSLSDVLDLGMNQTHLEDVLPGGQNPNRLTREQGVFLVTRVGMTTLTNGVTAELAACLPHQRDHCMDSRFDDLIFLQDRNLSGVANILNASFPGGHDENYQWPATSSSTPGPWDYTEHLTFDETKYFGMAEDPLQEMCLNLQYGNGFDTISEMAGIMVDFDRQFGH